MLRSVYYCKSVNELEIVMWTKPSYKNIRLGFEITMYFVNR